MESGFSLGQHLTWAHGQIGGNNLNLKKMIMVRQSMKQHCLKSVFRKSRFKSTLHVCQLLESRNMKSHCTPEAPHTEGAQ